MINKKTYKGIWCGESAPHLATLAQKDLAQDTGLTMVASELRLDEALSILDISEITFSFIGTPLSYCPTTLPENLVAAALGMREEPITYIYTNPDKLDFSQDLFLKGGSIVSYSEERFRRQLQPIRNDLNWTQYAEDEKSFLYDALISSQPNPPLKLRNWDKRTISPLECVSVPGAGAVVYICRKDDLELRKHLKKIHCYETSWCTNTERKIYSALPISAREYLSAYMYKDKIGHFHIAVHIGLPSLHEITWRESSSSSSILEAEILKRCTEWIEKSSI